ncbi:unnamed protein product [Chrysoparadoxa australica]
MTMAGLAAALICSALGFTALAAASYRQGRDLLGSPPGPLMRWTCRTAGYLLLTCSLTLLIRGYGPAMGITAWTGLLSLGAIVTILFLSFLPLPRQAGR